MISFTYCCDLVRGFSVLLNIVPCIVIYTAMFSLYNSTSAATVLFLNFYLYLHLSKLQLKWCIRVSSYFWIKFCTGRGLCKWGALKLKLPKLNGKPAPAI